jgi:hypothetical protein
MSTQRDSTTDKRQKNQYCLAFPEESRGAAPMAFEGGTESELAKRKQKVRLPSNGWKKSASGKTASRRYDE